MSILVGLLKGRNTYDPQDKKHSVKRLASITVVFGDPAGEILQKVEELNCDIVIPLPKSEVDISMPEI